MFSTDGLERFHQLATGGYDDAAMAGFDQHTDGVGEIHLAGHAQDEDDQGHQVLIDAHDRQVIEPVWQLLERTLHRTGPVPTLVEWDNDVPEWPTLFAEAARAEAYLENARLELKEATHAVV